jgi:site-specific DNA recombinase
MTKFQHHIQTESEVATLIVDLYIRVSTDRQAKEGDSLEEQESELKKFCDYRGFQIHRVLIERGKSGGNTNRPEYRRLVADIEAGKINAVVVKKLDRLSRSLLDFEQLMTRLQANNVEFISLRENFDTTTAMGKAMLRVALVFAQLEREQTAERIKDVFAWRAEQGLYNGGTRPFGYDALLSELVPHKQERKVVEFIYDSFLELKSTTLVARKCLEMGFRDRDNKPIDKRKVHKILNRPIYKGFVKWNDALFKGIHQPLVTESKWEKVQAIFTDRETVSSRNKVKGLLKGFLICGKCHNYLSPNYTKKKNGSIYEYYRCASTFNHKANSKCEGQYRPLKEVHELVFASLSNFATEAELTRIKKKLAKHNAEIQRDIQRIEADIAKSKAQLNTTKQKKERYLDSLIAGNFSQKERKLINDKIDEFSLLEKQLETDIYRETFQLAELKDKIVAIDPFKESVLKFKVNYEAMTEKELKDWLKANLGRIILDQDIIKMDIKKLPFRLE